MDVLQTHRASAAPCLDGPPLSPVSVPAARTTPAAPNLPPPARPATPARPHPLHIGEVPPLDERFTAAASRACTVVVCGGSSSKPGVVVYEPFAAALAGAVVEAGGNVVTGGVAEIAAKITKAVAARDTA